MGRKGRYPYNVGGRMTEQLIPSEGRIFYDYDMLNALRDKSYSRVNKLGNDHLVQKLIVSKRGRAYVSKGKDKSYIL